MGVDNIRETVESTVSRTDEPQMTIAETEQGGVTETGERTVLHPGQTIAKDYVVINQIGDGGTQASVYVARREGKTCAIKLYHRGYKPAEGFIQALKGHSCPYVAGLIDYGYEDDVYYEIYEFYADGTLEDKGKCSLSFIKKVVIPNINEGLHFLHTLNRTGIVHGDIKPSNIFVADKDSRVVIGDFGISAYMDQHGKLIDQIRGTPEYAPRTVSFFGKATKTPAYDYGSFGLLLIKLATGHSLFEGLDQVGIVQAWEHGIEVPANMDGRLRQLIEGLLIEDEQKKFGYEEVRQWCEGEYVKIRENNIYPEDYFKKKRAVEPDPMFFGVIDGRIITVASLKDLATAIAENWDQTKKLLELEHPKFFAFIEQFDEEASRDIHGYAHLADKDAAVFYTLYRLGKNSNLYYKGTNYGSAKAFVESLNEEITEDQRQIITHGLFAHFLRVNGYDAKDIASVEEITKTKSDDPKLVPLMLYYLFRREKIYTLHGKEITTAEELIAAISEMEISEIEELTQDSRLLAWLYNIGYREDILQFFEL